MSASVNQSDSQSVGLSVSQSVPQSENQPVRQSASLFQSVPVYIPVIPTGTQVTPGMMSFWYCVPPADMAQTQIYRLTLTGSGEPRRNTGNAVINASMTTIYIGSQTSYRRRHSNRAIIKARQWRHRQAIGISGNRKYVISHRRQRTPRNKVVNTPTGRSRDA